MKKILFLLLAATVLAACESIEEKAARIHRDAFTLDSHTDTPLNLMHSDFDLAERHDPRKGGGKIDFPRMEEGGLDAAFFAVFLGQSDRDSAGHAAAYAKANAIFDAVYKAVGQNPAQAEIAIYPEDGFRLEEEGKRAIYLGIENAYALGGKLEHVKWFYDRGARYITLVHSSTNDLADSSTDSAEYNGLSAFGGQVVLEMNRLGILVDVSHASDSAFYDVLRLSKAPVIASHSCARALCDHPRNLTDDMLKALAAHGGVAQMCILSDYVKKMKQSPARDSAKAAFHAKYTDWASLSPGQRQQAYKEWDQLDVDFPPVLASVQDVVDHIDHMVAVAGIDHVGIGTDFDGGGGVEGCYDVSELPQITLELVKRGYSETDIAKIWGGNFIRVFKEAEAVATS